MNLVRFDPFHELQAMSSRLNRVFGQPVTSRPEGDEVAFFTDWAPAIDVQETDVEFLFKADLPEVSLPTGVDDQHVTAEFREGVLNVHVPKVASAKTGAIGVPIA